MPRCVWVCGRVSRSASTAIEKKAVQKVEWYHAIACMCACAPTRPVCMSITTRSGSNIIRDASIPTQVIQELYWAKALMADYTLTL